MFLVGQAEAIAASDLAALSPSAADDSASTAELHAVKALAAAPDVAVAAARDAVMVQ